MTPSTKRRKRRRAKAMLKNPKAVRKHKKVAGRTGAVHQRKPKAKAGGYSKTYPNPEPGIVPVGTDEGR